MKRYEIRNKATGQITHSYQAESPMEHQPAWGTLEWVETVPVLDEQGEPVVGEDGLPQTAAVTHPQTYEVIVTDIAAEYALADCHRKRASAYPALGEFADAFVKLQQGDPAPMQAYVAACAAVKASIPKP